MIKKSSIDKLLDILLPINSFQSKDSKIRINFDKFNAYFVKQNLAIQDKNKFKKSERKEDHDIDIYESVKYEGAVFSGPRDMVSRMKTGKYEKEEIGLLNKMLGTS